MQKLKVKAVIPSYAEYSYQPHANLKRLSKSLKSFSVNIKSQKPPSDSTSNEIISKNNSSRSNNFAEKIRNTNPKKQDQPDTHDFCDVYQGLTIHAYDTHSTITSFTSCENYSASHESKRILKNTNQQALQEEILQRDVIVCFNVQSSQKQILPTIHTEFSTLETEEREVVFLDIDLSCSFLRKIHVCKPEFFFLPLKLLNDDMMPDLEEDSIEYEYLDLNSCSPGNASRDIILEVDEEEESGFQIKLSF